MTAEQRRARPGRAATFFLALLLGAAIWGAWLGWDRQYYLDPGSGTMQGPYRPAQVVGCGLTFLLVTAALASRWRPVAVALGTTAGFWLVWTVDAASQDPTGLFLVGSMMLMVGLVSGSALAALVGYALGSRADRRPG
ncbi:hypothetical protein ACI3EY_02610 [Ornithinimicrobium sp. LYQ92]|uniref:hypothetical protein n=1 Tax=Serinicoccus sp. LYQ92 TaxID=3378798 RepID=UPI0038546B27